MKTLISALLISISLPSLAFEDIPPLYDGSAFRTSPDLYSGSSLPSSEVYDCGRNGALCKGYDRPNGINIEERPSTADNCLIYGETAWAKHCRPSTYGE